MRSYTHRLSEAAAVQTKHHLISFYELDMVNLQKFYSSLDVAATSLKLATSWNFGREANIYTARPNSINSILP